MEATRTYCPPINVDIPSRKPSLTDVPRLQPLDYETLRILLKLMLTKPLSADDLLNESDNSDLQLGFLNRVLTLNSDAFL